jgi:hypothetical protein
MAGRIGGRGDNGASSGTIGGSTMGGIAGMAGIGIEETGVDAGRDLARSQSSGPGAALEAALGAGAGGSTAVAGKRGSKGGGSGARGGGAKRSGGEGSACTTGAGGTGIGGSAATTGVIRAVGGTIGSTDSAERPPRTFNASAIRFS